MLHGFALGLLILALEGEKLPSDKAAHIGISASATAVCGLISQMAGASKWTSRMSCFAGVNLAGAMKEYTDPNYGGTRDEKDIYANLLGSGMSLFALTIAF